MALAGSFNVLAGPVLVIGDSISAAFGLDTPERGWVALLQQKLKPRGIPVFNASISGETTAGGLARIDELLTKHQPSIVVVELGGNDGLRGLSPKEMRANLADMIGRAQAAKAEVLLVGMRIPPNYGKRYTDLFQSVYPQVAAEHKVPLVPFLLDGIGGERDLMQTDGIHPNLKAQPILLSLVWQKLEPMLK
jgi:acyl-CoA thioesterase-1